MRRETGNVSRRLFLSVWLHPLWKTLKIGRRKTEHSILMSDK